MPELLLSTENSKGTNFKKSAKAPHPRLGLHFVPLRRSSLILGKPQFSCNQGPKCPRPEEEDSLVGFVSLCPLLFSTLTAAATHRAKI